VATHSYAELEGLWIQAGGNPAVAPIMAAIAMAESGGRDIMQQGQPQATTGCGIWQITPPQAGCQDSLTNAQQAVAKYNDQGLSAWTTYTGGQYRQFYNPGVSPADASQVASMASPSPGTGCCVWSAGSFCMDGLIGWFAVVIGAGAALVGIIAAGRAIV